MPATRTPLRGLCRAHVICDRAYAAGSDQATDVEHLGLLDRATELPPDLGHVEVSGRQPGVRCDDPVESGRVLSNQAESDQPAPILADEGDLAQVEVVKDQFASPVDQPGVGIVRLMDRFVGAAETDQDGSPRSIITR